MVVNVDDKIRKLSTTQRKKVKARATELLAEEVTLRELRKAPKLAQVTPARAQRSASVDAPVDSTDVGR